MVQAFSVIGIDYSGDDSLQLYVRRPFQGMGLENHESESSSSGFG
jgi:hypothetical protein